MSRIGKYPVDIPAKVKARVEGSDVFVEGPKGKLQKSFDRTVNIRLEDSQIVVEPATETRQARAMWGTARSIINGMVQGVQEPFRKNIIIEGVGFKVTAKGRTLDIALGYSHPILYPLPDGVDMEIDKTGTKLSVVGPDKQAVGQVAADIKSYRPVEPYKGKGVRIEGEFVLRKEGKKAK
ncbi:MAG: 50S ribosomal protein L6 [Opitutales bacterium]